MKRLLAYLFIVFGLGLTFSVNANSAKYSYDKDFVCFQIINGTTFVGSSKSGWVTETNNIENICSIFVYKDHHPKEYSTITKYWPFLLKTKLYRSTKIPVHDYFIKNLKLNKNKFKIARHQKKLIKEKTQIAKAEPSQTQKAVEKVKTNKLIKKIDLLFCQSSDGFLATYTNDSHKNCPSWAKKEINGHEWAINNNQSICVKDDTFPRRVITTKKSCDFFNMYEAKYNGSSYDYTITNVENLKNNKLKIYKAYAYGDKTGNNTNQLFLGVSDKNLEIAKQNALNNCKLTTYGNSVCKIHSLKLEKIIKDEKTVIAKAEPSQTQKVAETVSLQLNKNEVDAIFSAVNSCWSIPLGLPYNEDLSVKIKVKFDPSGNAIRTEIIDFAKINKKGNAYLKVLAESALRAIKLCSPIRAPKDKYYLWKEVVFNFDAKDVLNGTESKDTKIAKNNLLNKEIRTQIAKAEPTIKPKKKVAKTTQEEFKPETKDIDNEAPVIEIAEAITVDSQAYTLKGKVKDKSQIYLTIDGRQVDVKKGKFELDRFNIDPDVAEEIKIVAIDKWNNRTEKTIKVTIDLQSTDIAKVYEELNPNNVKVKTDKNKIAIIIGIEKYENLTNLDAKYANRDAKAFRAYATRALGIKPSNIKMLIDDKAKRGNTLEAFKIWLPKMAGKGGKDIHIFFAGHGLASENGKDLYVLPQDGNAKLLDDTAITRLELISLIQKVNPKSVTMFFDTCYSGQTRDEKMLVASLLRPIQIITEEQDTPDNFTIFSASNYDQVSGGIEEAQHGMFSYYLMKGLEGKADENKDKKITNGELIAYLKENVSVEALTQNREQDPMLAGDPNKVLMSYR